MEGCIANLEWMYLTKQPTLLACDMRTLLVLQFRQNQLVLLQNVQVNQRKISASTVAD